MPALRSLEETRTVLLHSGLTLIVGGNPKPELGDAADRRSINHTDALRIWPTQQRWLEDIATWVLTRTWVQGHRTVHIHDVTQTNQLIMMASLILAAGDPTRAHLIGDRIDELDQRTHNPEVTNEIIGQSIRQNAVAAVHRTQADNAQHDKVNDQTRHHHPTRPMTPDRHGTNSYTATAHPRHRPTSPDSLRV